MPGIFDAIAWLFVSVVLFFPLYWLGVYFFWGVLRWNTWKDDGALTLEEPKSDIAPVTPIRPEKSEQRAA